MALFIKLVVQNHEGSTRCFCSRSRTPSGVMATKIMATLSWLVLMFILAAVLSAIMVVMGVWMLYMITDHPDHPCRCPRRYLSINETLSITEDHRGHNIVCM